MSKATRTAILSIEGRRFALPISVAAAFMEHATLIESAWIEDDKGKTVEVRWVGAANLSLETVEGLTLPSGKPASVTKYERGAALRRVMDECKCDEEIARLALDAADWSSWGARKYVVDGCFVKAA